MFSKVPNGSPASEAALRFKIGLMHNVRSTKVLAVLVGVVLYVLSASIAFGQSCEQNPGGNASVADVPGSLCPLPTIAQALQEVGTPQPSPLPPVKIELAVPAGTPLRIELDQRVRINHAGEVVHGKVVETVYAFDEAVIPAGSIATGHVAKIEPVPGVNRALSYSDGNFSPAHKYELAFDEVTLPDGKPLTIETTVSPGTAQVMHLVSNPAKERRASATDRAKEQAHGKIQEAKDEIHDSWDKLTAPGKMHRVKQYLLAQSPYRRQYLEPGTLFVADLVAPLNFGETTRTVEQLAAVGDAPAPDSTLKARLVAEVSSATATRGAPVTAILTEPLYSPAHVLLLPANSRLVGEVVQAKAAEKLHHNGELRVTFERIETPEDAMQALAQAQQPVLVQQPVLDPRPASDDPPDAADATEVKLHSRSEADSQIHSQAHSQVHSQAMIGNLQAMDVDRNSNIKLDDEGGAHTTDNKTRYLSTGLTVLLAAAASHPDAERGHVDAAGDPSVRAAAGGSGFRLTGAVISLAAKSNPVSIAFSAYGASASIYSNFLSRGHDVILPKDTPLEIGFGPPHPASQTKQQ